MGRRVLQVHRGEVAIMRATARAQSCPEIQERDDVAPGTFRVLEEPDPPPETADEARVRTLRGEIRAGRATLAQIREFLALREL